ncbi:MAG TPA: sulfatase, partial [Clostridiales bacterium]|nr:sulfatase [Clostridiales bacterium]
HYWEDGGATYHTRYSTWECARGQEGDSWKAQLPIKPGEPTAFQKSAPPMAIVQNLRHQDRINRQYTATEETMPQAVTFRQGLDFLENNFQADNWFLQIETFDPHEPFYTTEEYKKLYPHEYKGLPADWPPYYPVQEDEATVQHVRYEYAALLSMCDHYLGRVLDFMDDHDLWQDTMLIVNTDHGFLLGEHDWWGKAVMPVYNEIARTPLFVWDPRTGQRGIARQSLVQTVDLAPTLLEFFGQPVPADMTGRPLRQVIEKDQPIRDVAVFGFFGSHVNITDGRFLYMRSPVDIANGPLFEYTLMPTHMRARFSADEMRGTTLAEPFSFTKGCPVLKIKAGRDYTNPYQFGNKLFDLAADAGQLTEIDDPDAEIRLIGELTEYLRANDAPAEQYQRLGIPDAGLISRDDLLAQWAARRADLDLGILTDYTWDEDAAGQFRALLNFSADNRDQIRQGFAVYAEKAAAGRKITNELVMQYLALVVPADYLEMTRYGLIMAGRSR